MSAAAHKRRVRLARREFRLFRRAARELLLNVLCRLQIVARAGARQLGTDARRRDDQQMSLSLLDWRRTVTGLYRDVRESIDNGQDPAIAHRQWRAVRDELFARHPDSPLLPDDRTRFGGLAYAPYDPELRWVLPMDNDVSPEMLRVQTGTDGTVEFKRIGRLRIPGGRGQLDVWWLTGYGGGIFVPVKDGLAGGATYGGGRYLLDTVKGADLGGSVGDGTLVVDLNFCYQPSCAYDPAWACPLAPPGNTLSVDVYAGELYVASEFSGELDAAS